jgi:hypothetical protein
MVHRVKKHMYRISLLLIRVSETMYRVAEIIYRVKKTRHNTPWAIMPHQKDLDPGL